MHLIAFRPTSLRKANYIMHLRSAMALRRERRELRLLDDHLLRDIGLTRAEADKEAARPVWDAPNNWRNQ
jgi:uncharacterized protein YjiS (DUF1127 family)